MSGPEDRELRDYLDGKNPLSDAYRQASQERTPADLDEAILARANAELRRKPSWNRALAPFALAASVLLGVNLAWNVYQVPAIPDGHPPSTSLERLAEVRRAERQRTAEESRPSPPVAKSAATPLPPQAPIRDEPSRAPAVAARSKRAEMPSAALSESLSGMAAEAAHDAGDPISAIEGLIAHVEGLQDFVVVMEGRELNPREAGAQLRRAWQRAGDSVHTTEDFIERCASRSPDDGEAYRMRDANGRERPLAEVLRENLRRR